MVLTITFLLLTILVNRAVSEDADMGREGRLISFEDSLSRADVGTYYLSFVVALAMLVPVFHLSPVGRGRSLEGHLGGILPNSEGIAGNDKRNFVS